jgi:hypothetical protein
VRQSRHRCHRLRTSQEGRPAKRARNLALSLGERFEDIKFLIRDRGSNFTRSFDAVFHATGARILCRRTRGPRQPPDAGGRDHRSVLAGRDLAGEIARL